MLSLIQRLKSHFWVQLFIVYTRYALGSAFVFASLIKIKGKRFTTESGALAAIDSPWHLFETLYASGTYWQFIGLAQLLAGSLLMTQRYAKLGAVMNLPIIANVFVITISYDFAYTPVITAAMLLANLLLIAWHWDELRVLVNQVALPAAPQRLETHRLWEWIGLGMWLFTVGYRIQVDAYDLWFWALGCGLLGALGGGYVLSKASFWGFSSSNNVG